MNNVQNDTLRTKCVFLPLYCSIDFEVHIDDDDQDAEQHDGNLGGYHQYHHQYLL